MFVCVCLCEDVCSCMIMYVLMFVYMSECVYVFVCSLDAGIYMYECVL